MSSPPAYNNVFFLGAARMAGQGIIVASYSYNTETELGAVKQVLEQPNMNLSPGKHYSFNVGQLAWHLISGWLNLFECKTFRISFCFIFYFLMETDDQALIYILICQSSYPQRCAHMCLEEVQRTVSTQ